MTIQKEGVEIAKCHWIRNPNLEEICWRSRHRWVLGQLWSRTLALTNTFFLLIMVHLGLPQLPLFVHSFLPCDGLVGTFSFLSYPLSQREERHRSRAGTSLAFPRRTPLWLLRTAPSPHSHLLALISCSYLHCSLITLPKRLPDVNCSINFHLKRS